MLVAQETSSSQYIDVAFSLIIIERMKPLSLTRSVHLSYEVGVTVY